MMTADLTAREGVVLEASAIACVLCRQLDFSTVSLFHRVLAPFTSGAILRTVVRVRRRRTLGGVRVFRVSVAIPWYGRYDLRVLTLVCRGGYSTKVSCLSVRYSPDASTPCGRFSFLSVP